MKLSEYDLELIKKGTHPKYYLKSKSIVWTCGWKFKRKLKGSLRIR